MWTASTYDSSIEMALGSSPISNYTLFNISVFASNGKFEDVQCV